MPEYLRNDMCKAYAELHPFQAFSEPTQTEAPVEGTEALVEAARHDLRVVVEQWSSLVRRVERAHENPEHWWNVVTDSFLDLFRVRGEVITAAIACSDTVNVDEGGLAFPPGLAEDSGSGTIDPVQMWLYAARLDAFNVKQLNAQIGDVALGLADVVDDPTDGAYVRMISQLAWCGTMRDLFASVLARAYVSDDVVSDFASWHMIAAYLVVKKAFHVFRDLGIDMTGAPEEARVVELQRIHAVYKLAVSVNRPLDQRVGTFERMVPHFDLLARRWDKPDPDAVYIRGTGLAGAEILADHESGLIPVEIARFRQIDVAAVDEVLAFYSQGGQPSRVTRH